MHRYFAYIILSFIIGCTPPQPDKKRNEIPKDTVDSKSYGQIPIEDFDILMQESEDPGRVTWQNPEMVISKMGNINDLVVADIGAGTGYFTLRIAKKGGTVIGIDIDQKSIDYIEERKSELPPETAERLTTRLSYPDDPRLDANETDWVLIVNTYYFIDDRVNYLIKVKQGLKKNGKIMVVDYKKGDMPIGPSDAVKVPITTAITEIKSAGFRILEIDNSSLQYQYIIVAQR
ncbi:MAG: class I SAM-dependent methyltransferase [Cyclobacteriaceae bacterium]|jgi:SAM-dependent methyltransferase